MMESKEELLAMGESLIECFKTENEILGGRTFRTIEKFIGDERQYFILMEKVRKYLLENNVYKEVREDFEKLSLLKPNKTALNKIMSIMSIY